MSGIATVTVCEMCLHLRYLHATYYLLTDMNDLRNLELYATYIFAFEVFTYQVLPLTDVSDVKNWNWNCMRDICLHLRYLHTKYYL